jgi:nitrate reductase delta subunit
MSALNSPPSMSKTLRVLAALLGYPDAVMRGYLPEMRALLCEECALSPSRGSELDA